MTDVQVMGILNATPDSFSDGGEIDNPSDRDRRIESMLAQGVDIIDVGGESTRPGHVPVAADEEIRRVLPVIRAVRRQDGATPISIDTRKPEVARAALDKGANLINDVSGFADEQIADVVAEHACAYIGMRRRDCERPVVDSCRRQLEDLLDRATSAGIPVTSVVFDPGLGFGSPPGASPEDNLALVDSISAYSLGRPVLIGASRKRFVGALVDEDDPQRRDAGSVAIAVRAARAGAAIVRVHDVGGTVAGLARAGLRPPRAPGDQHHVHQIVRSDR